MNQDFTKAINPTSWGWRVSEEAKKKDHLHSDEDARVADYVPSFPGY
jgi:hypothetical protein